MEKLVIATDRQQVAGHFGHCDSFLLVEADDGRIRSRATLAVPDHSPCSLPDHLAGMGVTAVIAGGLGVRAQQGFAEYGIRAFVGVQGPAEEALAAWLDGSLESGANVCTGHDGCGETHAHGETGCSHE